MVRRRGFSLMEITAAGILLVAMLVVCMQFFRATAIQRRGLQARRVAIREVANVMERLCARPWQELTLEGVRDAEPSAEVQRLLPDSALEIDVTQPNGEPDEKRIAVVLRWPAGPEQPDRSVRLVAWKYRVGEDY